jgi:hypothetical protein
MKKLNSLLLVAFCAVIGAAAPANAASRSAADLLSLVPPDAATVAVVRLNDLRESPIAARLFANADRIATDGDAARFLEEAQLNPKKDVDVIVVAASPSAGRTNSPALVLFQGRFDTDRLAGAALSRGAIRRTSLGGDYFLLPDKDKHSGDSDRSGAVAFVSSSLVIAGHESAVIQALADRQSGGTSFASGTGLGRELKRVDRTASFWALVDVNRFPSAARNRAHMEREGESGDEPARAMMGAMKSVSLVAVQASARGDALEVTASGVARDPESRQLLEDSLRGLMAMWRLAIEDKSPELVSVLRQFSISSDGDAVSIHGTLSGSALRMLSQKKSHASQN